MLKSVKATFLTAVLVMTMIMSPWNAEVASARTVTNDTISDQEKVAEATAREAVEEYMRLILYIIISRLEAQVEAND
ncbi:hypothetical protein COU14_03260 [Candidatus Kaiserbacteria bacterium CG10_big_fil_rev_8_21_14_0_10_44_10]|uniref:DUF5667 domain-containing protein n=1 Tax=Candidatus Kaiserbacteria bacterium CG10_big_fil_rev_8_21_14_0_10_44_10 TaxID=1974606 RepID=A0A2H0UH02_9BACT|nr:MAG: hypothetical protein COU14_03260 [Candidatus Kaiserbacteria bacterium CG10_big_fil_rev_8_21_14_0_10_44_10]